MTTREDCIDEILKAVKGRMNREQVEDAFARMDERAEESYPGMSPRERYARVRDEMLNEHIERAARRRANDRLEALRSSDLHRRLDYAMSPQSGLGDSGAHLGIEAILNGVNHPFFDPKSRSGGQQSLAGLAGAMRTEWVDKGFLLDLERQGLDKVFASRAIQDKILLELYELDRGAGGRPGVTKDKQALDIAKAAIKWNKVALEKRNEEGAWIGSYLGHMVKMSWDTDKVRKAASPGFLQKGFTEADRQAFVADVMKNADLRRTFGQMPRQEIMDQLGEMYGGFVTGDHLDYKMPFDESSFPNVAAAASVHREIHWKDGPSALAMFKKYSRHNPTEAILQNYVVAARQYALLKVLGSEPEKSFENLLTYTQNKTKGTQARILLDKNEAGLRARYAYASGDINKPITGTWAGLVYGDMMVQRLSKLGSTILAMISDNATMSRELSAWGASYMERNETLISGYFRGAAESDKRERGNLVGAGLMAREGYMASRFDAEDSISGRFARWEHNFFKYTGMTPATENKRLESRVMMATQAGSNRGTAWDKLDPRFSRMLERFGIGDHEWALLNTAEWNKLGDHVMMTPDVPLRLSDDAVRDYSIALRKADIARNFEATKAKGGIAAEALSMLEKDMNRRLDEMPKGDLSKAQLDRIRNDLGLKIATAYHERGLYAVVDTGAREKAMLYGRTAEEHPNLHLALKLLYQFKQFPTAMIVKTWGNEIHGGNKGMGRLAGITELILAGTVYGALTNYLNDVIKLQDPNSRWRNQPVQALAAAFMRGGAGSIYGDLVLGEWSRFGMGALDTLAGPTFGQTNRIFELWTDLTHAKGVKKSAALALGIARSNLPFGNTIATKAAVDYLLLYSAQEWLNPGYLGRYERSMKEKAGTEFLLRPSQAPRW